MTIASFIMHVVVRVGDSPEKSLQLVETEPLPPLSVGTQGAWLVRAEGVAPIHGYLFFDGKTLYVSSATPASPVMVQGRPVGSAWQPVQPNTEIVIGQAVLFVEPPSTFDNVIDESFDLIDDEPPTIMNEDVSGWRKAYAASREASLEEISGETIAFVPPRQGSGASFNETSARGQNHMQLAPPPPPPAAVSPATSVSEHYPNAPSAPVRPGTVVAPMAAPPARSMSQGSSTYDREEMTRFEPLKSVSSQGAGGVIGGSGPLPPPASAMGSGFAGTAAAGGIGQGFRGPPGVSGGNLKRPSGLGTPPGVSTGAMGGAAGFVPPPGVSVGAVAAATAGLAGPPAALYGGPPLAPMPAMPPVAGFSAPMGPPTAMAPTDVPKAFAELAAQTPEQPSQPQPWHQQLKQQWQEVSLPKKLIAIMIPLTIVVYLIPMADPPDNPKTLPAAASASTPSPSAPVQAGSSAPDTPTAVASATATPPDTAGSADEPPVAAAKTEPSSGGDSGEEKLKPGEKTKQRLAVDAVISGDFAVAIKIYEELVVEYPNDQTYKDALRILKSSQKQ